MLIRYQVDGEKILMLRKKMGWSQTDLGIEMEKNGFKKISIRTIQKIENDPEYSCTKKVIGNLATTFDVRDIDIINVKKIKEEIKKPDDDINVNKPKLRQKNLATENKKNYRPDGEKREVPEEIKKLLNKEESEYDKWFLSSEEVGEVDYLRKFTIDEGMIGCIIRWVDFKLDIEAREVFMKGLRQLKLVPTEFGEIVSFWKIPNKKDEKWMFTSLCQAELHSKSAWSEHYGVIDYDWKILSGCTVFGRDYEKIAYDHDVDTLFKHFEDVNYFTIDYLIPDDNDSYEIIYQTIDLIEKYFVAKQSIADELKYKYKISSLKKKMSDKKISLFYRSWSEKELTSDKNSNYKHRKSIFAKIFIKSWSSENVIDLERYVDSNFQSYNRYNKTWINPEESEKENESYEEMIKKLNDPDGNSFMKKEYPSESYGSF